MYFGVLFGRFFSVAKVHEQVIAENDSQDKKLTCAWAGIAK